MRSSDKALQSLMLAAFDLAVTTMRDRGRGDRDGSRSHRHDRRNWHRIWGAALLDNDPHGIRNPFRDPAFLLNALRELSRVSTTRAGFHSPTDSRRRFERALRRFAPALKLVAIAESGTDAVNIAFDIAAACGQKRPLARRPPRAVPTVAFFDGSYGGVHGVSSGIPRLGLVHDYGRHQAMRGFRLPDTSTLEWPIQRHQEAERLDAAESRALHRLEMLADPARRHPIGGVLIEPIQGVTGVRFHRPSFLRRLRALADRHGIPLIADETLTGGGRTGRFFAFEHYPGFAPDFVVFGKGLLVCGVASVRRARQKASQRPQPPSGVTTFFGDSLRLLRAARILDVIYRRRLVANAGTVGTYLRAQLARVERDYSLDFELSGTGLLIGIALPKAMEGLVHSVFTTEPGRRRLLPPLTLTKSDVDRFIHDLRASLDGARDDR